MNKYEFFYPTRIDAEKALETLRKLIEDFGVATVSDLCELSSVQPTFMDIEWGWTDLSSVTYNERPDGWCLVLPKPILFGPETELKPKSEMDLIRKYADKAAGIYEARTAGDFTWEGLLGTFLREFLNV